MNLGFEQTRSPEYTILFVGCYILLLHSLNQSVSECGVYSFTYFNLLARPGIARAMTTNANSKEPIREQPNSVLTLLFSRQVLYIQVSPTILQLENMGKLQL